MDDHLGPIGRGNANWRKNGEAAGWSSMALGFEQRDAPHYLKQTMTGQIRRWHKAQRAG
jgi:hypothetical protein